MGRQRRLVVLTLLAVSLAGTGACGHAAATGNVAAPTTIATGASPTAPRPPVGGVCDLISLHAMSEFLGQPARIDEQNQSECIWRADARGTHQVHLQVYSQYSYFSPDTWGGTPEMIDGLGQEAFLVRQAMVGTTAAYWDGLQAVFLNYTVLVGSGSTQAKADDLVELLRSVAERS
jgi:hypothetical protein